MFPRYMLVQCARACNVCPAGGMAAAMASPSCLNRHAKCAEWAKAGQCSLNPRHMHQECAQACRACHLLDPSVRCRPRPGRPAALQPNAMDALFARAAADFPDLAPRVLSKDPWVLVYDTFLSLRECAALIAQGRAAGFAHSGVGLTHHANGTTTEKRMTDQRTSRTAWCQSPACLSGPVVAAVHQRVEAVTQVPHNHSEFLQVLLDF